MTGAAVVFARLLSAADPSIAPGDYLLSDGGEGSLVVHAPEGGTQAFEISVTGGNASTCELGGTLVGGKAELPGVPGQRPCHIAFHASKGAVEVAPDDACHDYCGARAWFEGRYLLPPPECLGTAQGASDGDSFRAHFAAEHKAATRLYAAKSYHEAADKLRRLLDACGPLADRIEVMWIRNDLAVALHHLGKDAECAQVLAPLADWARQSDPAAGEPSLEDQLLKAAKATRTNLKLCGGSVH